MDGNFIKINRKILEWEWYSDTNTCRLFMHMLLKANWREGRFKGTTVPRGSFVSSLQKLSEETCLTTREVRTAIAHLKMTGEATSKSHSKFTIFTVLNYDLYQSAGTQNGSQETEQRHTGGHQPTGIEERKEEKEGKKKRNNTNRFVPPTAEEVREYCQGRNNAVDAEQFTDFYSAKGWTVGKSGMKDWRAAVRTWERNRRGEVKKDDRPVKTDVGGFTKAALEAGLGDTEFAGF